MRRADNKFTITSIIRTILLASPRITQKIGDKVFPLNAEKGTQGDFIICQRDGYFTDRSKMGITGQGCKMYVSAVSGSYNRSVELAELIYEALEGDFSEPDMSIRLEDSSEEYVDGKSIQILLFSIN